MIRVIAVVGVCAATAAAALAQIVLFMLPRGRYDAARAIDAFAERLRRDVELDSVRADLIGVVHDTMHPAHASVWLRGTMR